MSEFSARKSALDGAPLGQASVYQEHYAPQLLFAIERAELRRQLGIAPAAALPFCGTDWWHAYELSWLNPRGKPMVACARLGIAANSPRLVESKSLKLYFNSLNQSRFDSVAALQACLERDLAATTGADATVHIVPPADFARLAPAAQPEGLCLDALDIAIDCYTPAPALLGTTGGASRHEKLYSNLLKSNCPVTGQPDWATIMIEYCGAAIDHEGLLRYLVSFRRHNGFHEHCVEQIFCHLQQYCAPAALAVQACYTRRGGLDINPFRSSSADFGCFAGRQLRQ